MGHRIPLTVRNFKLSTPIIQKSLKNLENGAVPFLTDDVVCLLGRGEQEVMSLLETPGDTCPLLRTVVQVRRSNLS